MDFDWEVGVGMGSVARASAESADVSGAKRFAGCSGATLVLRVMRCDAMRGRCEVCGDSECDCCCWDTVAEVDTGVRVSVSGCDFDFDECPLGTGPLRLYGLAGPPSLFSLRWCNREHSVLVPHT